MSDVALVHEWLVTRAGSEKVVEAILECHPGARVFTTVFDPTQFSGSVIARHEVVTTFIQSLPGAVRRYQTYLPFMPLAIEQLDLSAADTIISSQHAVAHGVLTRADQLHISYVHSPVRYGWDLYHQYLRDAGLVRGPKAWLARMALHRLRQWDVLAANRVDLFVANSAYVARRVWRVYRRPARVLYPPVDVERFSARQDRDEFYVVLSRLVPYKRVDVIVEAFNALGRPLVVLGDGPERERLQRMARGNISFLGRQSDDVVRDYLQRARAFVFAADEDFGIVSVEAQAAGCPVIAYGHGGSLETVAEGRSGVFFPTQTAAAVQSAVLAFEAAGRWDAASVRENAERFSAARFKREWLELFDAAQGLREDPVRLERTLAVTPGEGNGSER